MDNRGLTSELDIFDIESGRASLSPPQKVKVQGNSMRLILFGECSFEMLLNNSLSIAKKRQHIYVYLPPHTNARGMPLPVMSQLRSHHVELDGTALAIMRTLSFGRSYFATIPVMSGIWVHAPCTRTPIMRYTYLSRYTSPDEIWRCRYGCSSDRQQWQSRMPPSLRLRCCCRDILAVRVSAG